MTLGYLVGPLFDQRVAKREHQPVRDWLPLAASVYQCSPQHQRITGAAIGGLELGLLALELSLLCWRELLVERPSDVGRGRRHGWAFVAFCRAQTLPA